MELFSTVVTGKKCCCGVDLWLALGTGVTKVIRGVTEIVGTPMVVGVLVIPVTGAEVQILTRHLCLLCLLLQKGRNL